MAITQSGKLYSWGSSDNGQLGLGKQNIAKQPTLVDFLIKEEVVDIYCGNSTSLCITKDLKVYGWGQGLTKSKNLLTKLAENQNENQLVNGQ